MMRLDAISAGYALDAESAGFGTVHSVFAHAVNLLVGDDLWTILASEKSDMPFGIRVAASDFPAFGIHPGEQVEIQAGVIRFISGTTINCQTATRWFPVHRAKMGPGFQQRLAELADIVHPRSWFRSADLAQVMKSTICRPARLSEALRGVIGCGPGATPSGDDVLIGVFAVLNSPLSGAAGACDATLLREALFPFLPTTTDISAHLLRQAASGRFGRDLHEFISALTAEAFPGEWQQALQRVLATGATSGADTCEGILTFAPAYFTPQSELNAA